MASLPFLKQVFLEKPPVIADDNVDLFSQNIYYENAPSQFQATQQKNGNISATAWKIEGRDIQGYGYTYDDLDRLTEAKYYDITFGTSSTSLIYSSDFKYNEKLTYDKRGNILTLERNGLTSGVLTTTQGYTAGVFGKIDNMSYNYNDSNQIKTILETIISDKGFKNIGGNNGTTQMYRYDKNGNLIYDRIKGIIGIDYNYLNLPQKITFGSGGITTGIILFVYDASGAKLRKIVQEIHQGMVLQETTYDYVNGVEYKNNILERIANTEGAVTRNGITNVYEYEYALRDHLGNTRATFSDANNDGIVTSADIKQINHYYPFGMNMEGNWTPRGANGEGNKYQYNGKEWNDDFGLNWNHHDWRFLDVAIDRFVTIDRKSEEDDQMQFSPYHFAKDNPIRYDDPDGQCPTCLTGFAIGFILDVATQVVFEGKSLSDVSYKKAAVAGTAGALSGGISSVVKMGKIASIVVNAGIDAAESVTKQAIDGKISGEQVVSDVIMGGIGNEVKIIKESDIKVKENTLNRAERVALGDTKSSGRAQNVVNAEKNLEKAKNVNAAGEIQAGNVLQSTSDKVRPLLASPKNNAPLMRPPAQIAQDQTRIIKPLVVQK